MAVKWRVQPYGYVDSDELSFGVQSRTRQELTHECSVHLRTGIWFCTCEWSVLSGLNKRGPTLEGIEQPCWHCRRVALEAAWKLRDEERAAKRVKQ